MTLNAVAVNAASTTSWATGDVNGPTMVWAPTSQVPATWTKATAPSASTWAKVNP